MKKFDKSWWKFSLDYDPGHWLQLYTPWGHAGVDHHRSVTQPGLSRGRCREWDLRIPLGKDWQIHLATAGKDYLTLVGGPDYLRNLSWILDEFDSSFNDLATASLRYHMDHAVTYCDDEQRAKYQDLIDRLNEPSPEFTAEEDAILHGPGYRDRLFGESTSEERAARNAWIERCHQRDRRIDQARHDFVDVMRNLWS